MGWTGKEGPTYWVPAIAIWSTTAFFNGQLHESLFTAAADGVRLARTLLHGKRGEKNGGNWENVRNECGRWSRERLTAKLIAIRLEQVNERSAVMERTAWLAICLTQLDCVEVGDREIGRVPSTAVDTAVQPADGAIGTGRCGNLACCIEKRGEMVENGSNSPVAPEEPQFPVRL
jgi:hypothetical protein